MENKKNWYVVYTKLKHEKRVAELLDRKSIVNFVPEQQLCCDRHRKVRVTTTAVFPSMLFVFAAESDHFKIRNTDGVIGILFWLQKPAIVHDEDVINLRQFLSMHSNVVVEKIKVISNTAKFTTDLVYNKNRVVSISGGYEKLVLSSMGFSLLAKPIVEDRVRIIA